MNYFLWLALGLYAAGIAAGYAFYSDEFDGCGWFQRLFITLLWPFLSVFLLFKWFGSGES